MINRGATKLVLVSRSGVTTGYQALSLSRWHLRGVDVLVSKMDASTLAGAKTLINEANSLGPVGGIFNLAAVIIKLIGLI